MRLSKSALKALIFMVDEFEGDICDDENRDTPVSESDEAEIINFIREEAKILDVKLPKWWN